MNSQPDSQSNQERVMVDNQALSVSIETNTGRIEVIDKVADYLWKMPTFDYSGMLTFTQHHQAKQYSLGKIGECGVAFKRNFYMKRNNEFDDFHDISLSGSLGDAPNTIVTIRYLLSNAFPELHCFLYVDGVAESNVSEITFPLGFYIHDSNDDRILLPAELNTLKSETPNSVSNELWLPAKDEELKVAGAPFYVLTHSEDQKQASCIGYPMNPLNLLKIERTLSGRFLTVFNPCVQEMGASLENPYHIRLQFLPTADLEAIAWTYHDYLHSEPPKFYL